MAIELLDLPNELLVQILGLLPGIHLKSMRLTCSLLAKIGSQRLFSRLYFAPRNAAMERLQDITADASFASHVTDLIYDARLFVPEVTSFAAHKMIYNEPQLYLSRVGLDRSVYRSHAAEQYRDSKHRYNGFHPNLSSLCSERDATTERHHEELAESLVQYTGFFDEQQHIFDGGQDLQCLRAGIEKLQSSPRYPLPISKVMILFSLTTNTDGTKIKPPKASTVLLNLCGTSRSEEITTELIATLGTAEVFKTSSSPYRPARALKSYE